MSEPRTFPLRDGRSATLRPASVSDAEASIELDRVLARDGRGMVLTEAQVRSVADERLRIDKMYAAWSAGDATLLCFAEVPGIAGLAGSSSLQQLAPARCKHVGILAVGVHPATQRLGLGRALMQYLIDHARQYPELERLELYVRNDNTRARALYHSLGFTHEGTRQRFVKLEDGSYVDDLILALWLR
jgi:putative acetyltransferase